MGQGVGGQSELSQTQRPTNTFAPAHTYTKGAMWNTVVVTLKTNVFFYFLLKTLQMFSLATMKLLVISSIQTAVTHPQILTITVRGESSPSANNSNNDRQM